MCVFLSEDRSRDEHGMENYKLEDYRDDDDDDDVTSALDDRWSPATSSVSSKPRRPPSKPLKGFEVNPWDAADKARRARRRKSLWRTATAKAVAVGLTWGSWHLLRRLTPESKKPLLLRPPSPVRQPSLHPDWDEFYIPHEHIDLQYVPERHASEPVYQLPPVQVLQRSYSLGADMRKAYREAYGLPTVSFSEESVFSESAGFLAGWSKRDAVHSPYGGSSFGSYS